MGNFAVLVFRILKLVKKDISNRPVLSVYVYKFG